MAAGGGDVKARGGGNRGRDMDGIVFKTFFFIETKLGFVFYPRDLIDTFVH